MNGIGLIITLAALSAPQPAFAQGTTVPTSSMTDSMSVLNSLSSVAEATTLSSSTTSYSVSMVPFNSGPDPFPIVLPSTVTLSSTYSFPIPTSSATTSQAMSDAFTFEDPKSTDTTSTAEMASTTADILATSSHSVMSQVSEISNPTQSGSSGAEEATNNPTTTSASGARSLQIAKTAVLGSYTFPYLLMALLTAVIALELLM